MSIKSVIKRKREKEIDFMVAPLTRGKTQNSWLLYTVLIWVFGYLGIQEKYFYTSWFLWFLFVTKKNLSALGSSCEYSSTAFHWEKGLKKIQSVFLLFFSPSYVLDTVIGLQNTFFKIWILYAVISCKC